MKKIIKIEVIIIILIFLLSLVPKITFAKEYTEGDIKYTYEDGEIYAEFEDITGKKVTVKYQRDKDGNYVLESGSGTVTVVEGGQEKGKALDMASLPSAPKSTWPDKDIEDTFGVKVEKPNLSVDNPKGVTYNPSEYPKYEKSGDTYVVTYLKSEKEQAKAYYKYNPTTNQYELQGLTPNDIMYYSTFNQKDGGIKLTIGGENKNNGSSGNDDEDKAKAIASRKRDVEKTTIDDIFSDGDSFVNKGSGATSDFYDITSIKKVSDNIYNILLAIAIIVAVIVGIIVGIKLITNGAIGKAEAKEALIPYFIGIFVVFGAFGIWKIIISILNYT